MNVFVVTQRAQDQTREEVKEIPSQAQDIEEKGIYKSDHLVYISSNMDMTSSKINNLPVQFYGDKFILEQDKTPLGSGGKPWEGSFVYSIIQYKFYNSISNLSGSKKMLEDPYKKSEWSWNSGNSKHVDENGVGGYKLKLSNTGDELHVESLGMSFMLSLHW